MHSDSDELASASLTFTRMHTGTQYEAEMAAGLARRGCTANCSCCSVERDQETITHGVDLRTVEPLDLEPNDVLVFGQQVAPASVSELGRQAGGICDVNEQHGRQHAA